MKALRKGFYAYLSLIVLFALLLSYWLLAGTMRYGDFWTGNRNYKIGDYGEAEINYKEWRSDKFTNPSVSFNLGNTYYQQGRYLAGIKCYHLAIYTSNDKVIKAKSWYNLGLCYFRINKLAESVEAFKESFLLQPTDKQTRLNLIYATQQLDIWKKKQLEKEKNTSKEKGVANKNGKDGEKDESLNTLNETESMLDMVLKDEQRKKNKIGKIKRKLNNLSRDEMDY